MTIFEWIQTILQIATLFLAYLVYRRFSLKENVLNKQFECVSELIKVLKHTSVYIQTTEGKGYNVNFFEIKNLRNDDNNFLFQRKYLYFTEYWYKNNPLKEYFNHPFLPKSIVKEVNNFQINLPRKIPTNIHCNTYITLKTKETNIKHGELIWNEFEPSFQSLKTFCEMSDNLRKEIEKWLKKYDANLFNFIS